MDHSLKVLIISRSFHPVISPRSFRTTELVKEFCRQGHDVTLMTVCLGDEQIRLAQEYGFTLKNLGPVRLKPIELAKEGPGRLWTRFLRRTTNLFFQYPDIELMWNVRDRLLKESGYDLLISIAVPHSIHWGVAWARSATHPVATTWIADCGDPFMGQENDTFRAAFYFRYLEKWFCRKADFVSVPVEGARDAYYPEFRNKIVVIPQGFDFDAVSTHEVPLNNGIVNFAYAGGFITGRRDLRPLLNFLLGTRLDFRLHIYTRQGEMVRDFADRSLGRIRVHDPVPRDTLLAELSRMDFLLNLENVGSRQTPSKLIDYAITGRPVLSVNSQDFEEEIILAFLNRDYTRRYQCDDIDRYHIENVVRQFLSCYEESRD